jgi:hypothetical protein
VQTIFRTFEGLRKHRISPNTFGRDRTPEQMATHIRNDGSSPEASPNHPTATTIRLFKPHVNFYGVLSRHRSFITSAYWTERRDTAMIIETPRSFVHLRRTLDHIHHTDLDDLEGFRCS